MFTIPENFAHQITEYHGADGTSWLERLPEILAACERRWHLRLDAPFTNLSFHYVATATRENGAPVVIKAHAPTDEFEQETTALQVFAGRGCVRLLDYDAIDEVQLLERLLPGRSLRTLDDDEEAISIATSVMRQLWRPVPATHPFPTVLDWGAGLTRLRQRYNGGCGPFPAPLLNEAEALFAELSTSMAEPVVLHGDLHQDNILAAGPQQWAAIDPKGLVGEPAYETGALLHNFQPELLKSPDPRRILARRIDQMAEELGFERARIRGWGLYQALLSAWWGVEDADQLWDDALTCAELLATIKV
jgi:streptomycin 6-kinase